MVSWEMGGLGLKPPADMKSAPSQKQTQSRRGGDPWQAATRGFSPTGRLRCSCKGDVQVEERLFHEGPSEAGVPVCTYVCVHVCVPVCTCVCARVCSHVGECKQSVEGTAKTPQSNCGYKPAIPGPGLIPSPAS